VEDNFYGNNSNRPVVEPSHVKGKIALAKALETSWTNPQFQNWYKGLVEELSQGKVYEVNHHQLDMRLSPKGNRYYIEYSQRDIDWISDNVSFKEQESYKPNLIENPSLLVSPENIKGKKSLAKQLNIAITNPSFKKFYDDVINKLSQGKPYELNGKKLDLHLYPRRTEYYVYASESDEKVIQEHLGVAVLPNNWLLGMDELADSMGVNITHPGFMQLCQNVRSSVKSGEAHVLNGQMLDAHFGMRPLEKGGKHVARVRVLGFSPRDRDLIKEHLEIGKSANEEKSENKTFASEDLKKSLRIEKKDFTPDKDNLDLKRGDMGRGKGGK
jgi:hypothetical protein